MIELVLFISGAVVMIFELVASRILAPFVGSSIYVWTAIIGVILVSLSLGYYQGGKLADKHLKKELLSNLIFLSFVFISITTFFKEFLLAFISNSIRDLRLSSVIVSLILFSPASFVLGAVTPYATRLKIESIKKSGSVVGRLYAISTLGSILGTFLGGFFLIGFLGSGKILVILGLTLFISSFVLDKSIFRSKKNLFLLIISFLLLLFSLFVTTPNVILDTDSNYSRILVYEKEDEKTGRPVRILSNSQLQQSAIYLDGEEFVFDYSKTFMLFSHFNKQVKDLLMIGGGGYTLPSFILKNFPEVSIDVVELDPKMTEVAKKYFNLKDSPRLKIYHTDGRSFLNANQKKYDVIFVDAYKSDFAMPFELVTIQAFQRYYDSLGSKGLLAMNIISSFSGDNSSFLRVVIKGLKALFPQVFIFKPSEEKGEDEVQNVVVFALKSKVNPEFELGNEIENEFAKVWLGDSKTNLPFLTDDFAPVERYTLSFYEFK